MRSNLCTIMVVGFILPATLSAQTPIIDYHQHLFSPDAAALVTGSPSPGISARDVIALLDSAGVRRALILSVAYTWGKASRATVDDEYNHVKAENDWTAQQVSSHGHNLLIGSPWPKEIPNGRWRREARVVDRCLAVRSTSATE